jgi:hypothetical protein
MRVAARRRRDRPSAEGDEPSAPTSTEDLPDILGTHRTYVGLRRGESWQLLAITSGSTTPLWEGRLDGSPGEAEAETSAMAAALLKDLTGHWAPPAVRDRLAQRVLPELSEATFAIYSGDLDAWLIDHDLDPQTWPSGTVPGNGRSCRSRASWPPRRTRS